MNKQLYRCFEDDFESENIKKANEQARSTGHSVVAYTHNLREGTGGKTTEEATGIREGTMAQVKVLVML